MFVGGKALKGEPFTVDGGAFAFAAVSPAGAAFGLGVARGGSPVEGARELVGECVRKDAEAPGGGTVALGVNG